MRKLQKGSWARTLSEDIQMVFRLIGRALLAFLTFQFSEGAFLMILAYVHLRYERQIVEEVEGGPDWPEGM